MYKTDPINFLLIIAVIYLLLKQCNIIENFQFSHIQGEINLTDLSTVSELAQKWENAFGVDNEGNVTFKKNVNIIPRGTIIAWNQATAPTGWALCDGQNGTPDLRGRFIRMQNNHGGNTSQPWKYQEHELRTSGNNRRFVGASRNINKTWVLEHAFNDKGGTDVVKMSKEELPSHKHEMQRPINAWVRSFEGANGDPPALTAGGGSPWVRNTNDAGGDKPHNNMPPYYVLSYIMKI